MVILNFELVVSTVWYLDLLLKTEFTGNFFYCGALHVYRFCFVDLLVLFIGQ